MGLGKIAVVVGVGPGTGGEAAKRFASEGYSIGLVSRKPEYSQGTYDQITKEGGKAFIATTDSTTEEAVKHAFKEIVDHFGASPEVLIFNARGADPKSWPPPGLLEVTGAEFESAFTRGVTAAFLWLQQVLPAQVEAGRGTVIITGATASLRGGPKFALLSAHKFALRSLSQTAAKEFQPKGVHIAHVIIDGRIKRAELGEGQKEDDYLLPEYIAEEYWKLHTQHRSTWTQELDLRPYTEKF